MKGSGVSSRSFFRSLMSVRPFLASVVLVVLTAAPAFKSADGGGTWTTVGLTGLNVAQLAIDRQTPTTIYALVTADYPLTESPVTGVFDKRNVESWHHVGTTSESGTPDVSEVPDFGGPSRTRTLDPLIKSQLLYQLS